MHPSRDVVWRLWGQSAALGSFRQGRREPAVPFTGSGAGFGPASARTDAGPADRPVDVAKSYLEVLMIGRLVTLVAMAGLLAGAALAQSGPANGNKAELQ